MKNMFSAGELAKLQKISKQTLLYYDKIGLFQPAYVDSKNGYRYYSPEQLDYLDTILIMKKVGFTLEEIKQNMEDYSFENSIKSLNKQITVINEKIKEWNMLKSRLIHRCHEMEQSMLHDHQQPKLEEIETQYLLSYNVEQPYSMREISIATKKCFAQALDEHIPIYFQCGVCVPFQHIKEERYTEATQAFLLSEKQKNIKNLITLPAGLIVSAYHFGNYLDIKDTYEIILEYCNSNHLKIISNSYEFCINDYITSKNEEEFITKIIFYIEIVD